MAGRRKGDLVITGGDSELVPLSIRQAYIEGTAQDLHAGDCGAGGTALEHGKFDPSIWSNPQGSVVLELYLG
jgi:hypothetical protein